MTTDAGQIAGVKESHQGGTRVVELPAFMARPVRLSFIEFHSYEFDAIASEAKMQKSVTLSSIVIALF